MTTRSTHTTKLQIGVDFSFGQVKGGVPIHDGMNLQYCCEKSEDANEEKNHFFDGRLVIAPVFHELRRELYGVPLHVVDAGEVGVDGGQHVL